MFDAQISWEQLAEDAVVAGVRKICVYYTSKMPGDGDPEAHNIINLVLQGSKHDDPIIDLFVASPDDRPYLDELVDMYNSTHPFPIRELTDSEYLELVSRIE